MENFIYIDVSCTKLILFYVLLGIFSIAKRFLTQKLKLIDFWFLVAVLTFAFWFWYSISYVTNLSAGEKEKSQDTRFSKTYENSGGQARYSESQNKGQKEIGGIEWRVSD